MKILDNILAEINNHHSSLLTKQELIEIIKKVLDEKTPTIIESNGVKLDETTNSVTVDDKITVFPKKEFKVLQYLIINSGRVVTRNELLKNIWGTEVIVGNRTIDVHIRKIRSKINRDTHLITRKCYGYMWVEN
jgi:two-component system alkaline phosphatase synthesis response regulator PhoP